MERENYSSAGLVSLLNQEFATVDDIRDKGPQLLQASRDTLDHLHKQLSLQPDTEFGDIYAKCTAIQDELAELCELHKTLLERCSRHTQKCQPLMEQLDKHSESMDKHIGHLRVLELREDIEVLCSKIQASLVIHDYDKAASYFRDFVQFYESAVTSNTESSFVEHFEAKLTAWFDLLYKLFSQEFSSALKSIKWPFTFVSSSSMRTTKHVKEQEFRTAFCRLAQLQTPNCMKSKDVSRLSELPPLDLMIDPLRTKFRFHFYGNRPTNDIAKPEIFLTQTVKWIRECVGFLESVVQDCLDNLGMGHVKASFDFIQGLVTLVNEKVDDLLDTYESSSNSDILFAHLLSELLAFDKELVEAYSYPRFMLSSMTTLQKCLGKWESLERKFACERIDELLQSSTAWNARAEDDHIPVCTDSFLSILQSLTGRIQSLRGPQDQLRLVRVQLDLLEDFRVRLRQVARASSSLDLRWFAAVNSLLYIRETLRNWSDDIFYVELLDCPKPLIKKTLLESSSPAETEESIERRLHRLISQLDFVERQSVFDEVMDSYQTTVNEMMDSLVRQIISEMESHCTAVRKDVFLGSHPDSTVFSSLFMTLRGALQAGHENLTPLLFKQLLTNTAKKLNQVLMQKVVLGLRYSHEGGCQLNQDMSKTLVPLLGVYTSKPDKLFKETLEACRLISLNKGSAVLLLEALTKSSSTVEDPLKMLQEFGVLTLTYEEAIMILRNRVDVFGD